MPQNQKSSDCFSPHHLAGAIFLILTGGLLLLGSLGVMTVDTMLMSWSILLILLGIKKLFKCSCC